MRHGTELAIQFRVDASVVESADMTYMDYWAVIRRYTDGRYTDV